jgi:DNA polymerase III delta subunit
MLYLIYGTDTNKRQIAREELLAQYAQAEILVRNSDDITMGEVEQVAGGMSLFNEKLLLLIESPFDNVAFSELLMEQLETLVSSNNVFVIYERELAKDIVKTFEKVGADIKLFDEVKKTGRPEFNIFSITDAFTARDKKGTWLLYREAMAHEHAPEEIVGVLFWAVKNMLLVEGNSGAAGLSPFVATKARRGLTAWKPEELRSASRSLVSLMHDAHSGRIELEEGCEAFLIHAL